MLHHRVVSRTTLVFAAGLALAVAGCSGNKAQLFQDNNEGGWFSKPMDASVKPDWARPTGDNKAADLGPEGPAGLDDLIGAAGRCGIAAPETAQASAPPQAAEAQPPADRPVGSVAGDLAGAPMPPATIASANPAAGMPPAVEPGAPQVVGGIVLGSPSVRRCSAQAFRATSISAPAKKASARSC